MTSPFNILDPKRLKPDEHHAAERRTALAARSLPPTLGNHREAAKHYIPDPDLVDAVNVAMAVGAPLLLTGEPGTGKTQLAHYLAAYFGIEEQLFTLFVRSTTTADDLLYRFDAVSYLRTAQDKHSSPEDRAPEKHITPGPLWKAYETDGPSVVLIDEVDKAPRDFPNDLLNVLDQHRFPVPELDQEISRKHQSPPVVIITSNSERRLPEPFLRRCIFHHIQFTPELVRTAVASRIKDFPNLDHQVREAAITRFLELRGKEIRKKPATAELLVWLTVLATRDGIRVGDISDPPLSKLPALSSLIKDREDMQLLR